MIELAYEGPDGCHYESVADYLFVGILGGCGCGTDNPRTIAVDVLKNFARPNRDPDRFSVYDNPAHEIMAMWLDSVGLLEHGTGIGGSWLTDKGKDILQKIETSATKEDNVRG